MTDTYAIVATKKVTVQDLDGADIELSKDQVRNLIVWDGEAEFAPGAGFKLVKVQDGWGIGQDGKLAPLPASDLTPVPVRVIAPRAFRLRFTFEERATLTLAASRALEAGDATLQVFLDDLSASQEVNLDHPDVRAGMDAIVAAQLIDQDRAAEILAA